MLKVIEKLKKVLKFRMQLLCSENFFKNLQSHKNDIKIKLFKN